MAGKLKVTELSDHELLTELKSRGLKNGPITKHTRRLFERILSTALGCDDSSRTQENDGKDEEDFRSSSNTCCTVPNITNECTSSIADSTTSSASQSPLIFYGVCFDMDCSISASEMLRLPAVFPSKEEALKAARKVKGARFKGFKSKEEAESFSRSSLKEQEQSPTPLSPSPSPADSGSNFKGPTPQELVKFRKIIERGTCEEFVDVVLNNPRYLIGPGDTPVILQEGARYNALHVAVKHNKREMCQLVVETLESDNFWNIYLNENSNSVINATRKQFLVDMYINTPDSGCWETPLHFACKFGHVAVVEYLVSHPLTDLNRPNKYGQTPAQMICSRCPNASSELKSQIESCLEDNCFVPLLGSEDNSTPPQIGSPWSPDVTDGSGVSESGSKGTSLVNWQQQSSPGEPAVTVRAYAGPMSPSKAAEFYHSWKTPPSNQERRNSYIQIKRKDDSRGVERIGRELAHNRLIPWSEYWSFLGSFADLSSGEGLQKLEDYLAKKKNVALLNKSVTPLKVRTLSGSKLRTPESRHSSVIVNVNGDLRQTEHPGTQCLRDSSTKVDVKEVDSLSTKKVLFTDSLPTVETESVGALDVVLKSLQSKPVDLNQQNRGENETNGQSNVGFPLHHIMPEECHLEDLAQKFKDLAVHQARGVSEEKSNEMLSTESSDDKDFLDSSNFTETSDKKSGGELVENALQCKKKLSYNQPGTNQNEYYQLGTNQNEYYQMGTNQNEYYQLGTNQNASENKGGDASGSVAMETIVQSKTGSAKDGVDFKKNDGIFASSTVLSDVVGKRPFPLLSENQHHNFKVLDSASEIHRPVLDSVDANSGSPFSLDSSKIGKHTFVIPQSRSIKHQTSHLRCGSCSDVMGLGDKSVNVFIQGSQPSKVDLDVLLAVGQVTIDPVKFPNITHWKQLVTSFSDAAQLSWPSPGSPRYRARQKSFLLWSC